MAKKTEECTFCGGEVTPEGICLGCNENVISLDEDPNDNLTEEELLEFLWK